MEVSDLRRRKLTAVFNAVDDNGNGFWELDDMKRIADGFAARSGWSEDSHEFQSLSKLLGDWWNWLRTGADIDIDGKVSLDEFVTTVAQFEQENHLRGLQLIFDVFDPSGDGTISGEEYRGLATIFHIDPAQADEIFLRLDLNGNGSISREEFTQLWIDFWYSEDEGAAGNWMFGPY